MGLDVKVLCLNGGSSSLKVALIVATKDGEKPLAEGEASVDREGAGSADALRQAIKSAGIEQPDAIGHRLVHGGPNQTAPLLLDDPGRKLLERAQPFAPLHLPSELAVVDAARREYPNLPHVACFDTAFHATLPEVARRLPIAAWADAAGVRRYGFHGLSFESVVSRLEGDAARRCVIAHLGSGASLAAIANGRSIDTTMGMSPTGGIMMGTRTGDLDPGALVYLMNEKGWGAREVEHFVNHESGLRGVSGTSNDMRSLLDARAHDPLARLAVDLFVYTAQKAIGALAVALGGVSSLVFTGGIGEKSAVVRAEIAARLGFLGVELDAKQNEAHAPVISVAASSCTVRVMKAEEEIMIARHTRQCLD